MSATPSPLRVSNITALLQALHDAPSPRTVDELHVARGTSGMTRAQIAKAAENARSRLYVAHDGGTRYNKRWHITDAGRMHLARHSRHAGTAEPDAADDASQVVDSSQARPWAHAAAACLGKTPRAARAEPLLPSLPAALVAGLPVLECDIDAVHLSRATTVPQSAGTAVGAEEHMALRQPLPEVSSQSTWTLRDGLNSAARQDACSAPGDPEFLCALFSNGVLSIESNGHHLDLPLEHTRKLLHYLEHTGAVELVETDL
jgi:hypothetical protein